MHPHFGNGKEVPASVFGDEPFLQALRCAERKHGETEVIASRLRLQDLHPNEAEHPISTFLATAAHRVPGASLYMTDMSVIINIYSGKRLSMPPRDLPTVAPFAWVPPITMGATFTIDALLWRVRRLLWDLGTSRPYERGEHCVIRMWGCANAANLRMGRDSRCHDRGAGWDLVAPGSSNSRAGRCANVNVAPSIRAGL